VQIAIGLGMMEERLRDRERLSQQTSAWPVGLHLKTHSELKAESAAGSALQLPSGLLFENNVLEQDHRFIKKPNRGESVVPVAAWGIMHDRRV
jgi:hypothetical protein